MKKSYFVFVLILLVSPIMAQNIPSYVPKVGLVGYWPFNGNANDESGNGNHGTVNGATLITDRNGLANSAYIFDGVDDYIECNSSVGNFGYSDFTVSSWVFCNSGGTVVAKRDTNTPSLESFWSLDFRKNAPVWEIFNANHTVGFDYFHNQNIYPNIWKFCTLVRRGTEISFYVDGQKLSTTFVGIIQNINNTINLTFGARKLAEFGNENSEIFNGQLDDISIYNRALTEQEIVGLFKGTPCYLQISQINQPTCVLKTGQINLLAHTGNDYSYSIDGKTYTSDTTFSDLLPGNYTVIVKHMSGCLDTSFVTIQPVPTSLTATTSQIDSVKICAGNSMVVSANSGRNYSYQWYKDNTLLQDSISKNLTLSKPGKYSVFVRDGACSDTSDYLVLDTIPIPDAPILSNNFIRICDDYSSLQNIIYTNKIDPSYRWYRSEFGTDSIIKKTWDPLYTGPMGLGMNTPLYLSQFSATNPACESKKRTMLMLEDKTPPVFNYGSSITFCPGDSIELNVIYPNNSLELRWLKDWMQIPNSQGKTSIFVNEAGYYAVTNMQCPNYYYGTKNSVRVNMQTVSIQEFSNYVLKNEAPITLQGNPSGGLFSGVGVTNSIFDPSSLKLGKTRIKYNYISPSGCAGEALKDVFVVDSLGTGGCTLIKYDTVKVTKKVTKYDTITLTDTVNILKIKFKLTTGIQANQMASMSVYPNPTTDVLLLEITDLEAVKGYRYRILDISGKEVYTGLITEQKTAVSLKTFGAGVYVLHVLDGNNTSIATKQIVLE